MRFRRRTVSDRIPTAAMADITFLLIIFFLVANTFTATRGLDFGLPRGERATTIEKEESVLIAIRPGGALEVDGKAMRLDQVLDYLRPRLEVNRERPIILRPDPEAAYGDMVRVYELLRRGKERGVEVENITIPTQREIDQFWY